MVQVHIPLPLLTFPFSSTSSEPVSARFVRFSLISWYGWGGGLQYFNVKEGEKVFTVCQNMQGKLKLKVRAVLVFICIYVRCKYVRWEFKM